jgi:hypothetical protein
MNFIEWLFHLSPDAGSGATEALFFAVAAIGFAIASGHKLARILRQWGASQAEN